MDSRNHMGDTVSTHSQTTRLKMTFTALITGANSGIGYAAMVALAKAQPETAIYVGCRNAERAQAAIEKLKKEVPGANLIFPQALDLSSLKSIQSFADRLKTDLKQLDLLINNAGVMGVPERRLTEDGFEMQFGTNHLGHFALTAHLMPLLLKSASPRVVTVSSLYARDGRIRTEDFSYETGYAPYRAYGDSKLGNLVFAQELQRLAVKAGSPLLSIAVHPGYTATNLQTAGTGYNPKVMGVVNKLFAQSEERGALPTMHAALSPK